MTAANLVNAGQRVIGVSEIHVGPLGLGLWRFVHDDVAQAERIVDTALELGMNLIDTAAVYGLDWGGTGFGTVEELLGEVFRRSPSRRERCVLATKGGILPPVPYDSSRTSLVDECEQSLRRLGTDAVDLYQVHRPDLFTHPAEVADALERLREAGKIREAGVSNHTPEQVEALRAHLPFPLATTQPEFSAAHLAPMRDGTFDQAMGVDLVPLAWSPLGGGRIAQGEGIPEALVAVLDRLAEREGVERTTIAYAFVLSHPSAPVCLVGTQRPDRLHAARGALDVTLTRSDAYDIVQASEGVPLP